MSPTVSLLNDFFASYTKFLMTVWFVKFIIFTKANIIRSFQVAQTFPKKATLPNKTYNNKYMYQYLFKIIVCLSNLNWQRNNESVSLLTLSRRKTTKDQKQILRGGKVDFCLECIFSLLLSYCWIWDFDGITMNSSLSANGLAGKCHQHGITWIFTGATISILR